MSTHGMTTRNWFGYAQTVALVAVGGFLGANARYGVSLAYPGLTGTFLANVTGSFVLGFVAYEAMYTDHLTERGRLLVATGFLSSYTTYSTFAFQTATVDPLLGLLNVAANYSFGFGGVVLGRWIALRIRGEARD